MGGGGLNSQVSDLGLCPRFVFVLVCLAWGMKQTKTKTKRTKHQLAHQSLHVWQRALGLARLVAGRPLGVAELRRQVERAVWSVGLNIAEGAALDAGSRRRHFKIARASLTEAVAAYELAAVLGERVSSNTVAELGARLARILQGLLR